MPRAPTLLLILAAACGAPPQTLAPGAGRRAAGAAASVNGSFEDGTLTGWTQETRLVPNERLGQPPMQVPAERLADLNLVPGGQPRSYARQAEPETAVPAGLTAGAVLRYPKFGQWAAVVNELGAGNNANLLRQSWTTSVADVDPADGKIHVRFAVAPVLQAPGHGPADQPYFFVNLANLTTGATLHSRFNYASQVGVPWAVDVSPVHGAIMYTPWQGYDVAPGPALLAPGDEVELLVLAAGCALGAHWGEVYVDSVGSFLPGLSVAATAPLRVKRDTDLTYTLLVKNDGQGPADEVVVTQPIPGQTSFVSAVPSQGVCDEPPRGSREKVVCRLGQVNRAASATVRVSVHVDPTATLWISNGNYTAEALGVTPLLGPLSVSEIVADAVLADLEVVLSDGVPALDWGQPTLYVATIVNHGPSAVTGARVTGIAPAELSDLSWSCSSVAGRCGADTGVGAIDLLVDLPAGATATVRQAARVVAGSGTGSVTHRVTASVPLGGADPWSANDTGVDTDGLGRLAAVTVRKDPAGTGVGTVVSSPAGISCGEGCDQAVAPFTDGALVSLTAAAAPGDLFAGWSGACAAAGTQSRCTLTLAGDATVAALFTSNHFHIATTAAGGGTLRCPTPVVRGQDAICTLAAEAGWVLVRLIDNGEDVTARAAPTGYTIPAVAADHVVSALFRKDRATACADAAECASGACADGVCCDRACGGQCEACDLTGRAGTCAPAPGAPRGKRPACASDGSVCGGTCDGTRADACTYPAGASAVCRAPTCTAGTATARAVCDGAGACPAVQTSSCGLYPCGAEACLGGCASDAGCLGGAWCSMGLCVAPLGPGAACSEARQCGTGHCVDGVCCDTACDGRCEACAEPGRAGTCSPVQGAPRGARPACATDGTACGGACDGSGRAACAYPGAETACRAATCGGGVASSPSACVGSGACPASAVLPCGLYTCGPEACRVGCAGDADCAEGAACAAGACVPLTTPTHAWTARGSGGCSGAGGAEAWPLLLAAAALGLARARRAAGIALAGALALAAPVRAQAQDGEFTADRFQPGGGGRDLLGLGSPAILGHLETSVSAWASWARDTLRFVDAQNPNYQVRVISYQTLVHVAASVGLLDAAELGLTLPLAAGQGGQGTGAVTGAPGGALAGQAVGDLRLVVNRPLVAGETFSASLALGLTLPTGDRASFLSTGRPSVAPEARVQLQLGQVRLAAAGGVSVRAFRQLVDLVVSDAVTFGAGAELPLVVAGLELTGLLTATGETPLAGPAEARTPIELAAAVRWDGPWGLSLTLGGGRGLTDGFGAPRFRAVASLGWTSGRSRASPAAPRAAAGAVPAAWAVPAPQRAAPPQGRP